MRIEKRTTGGIKAIVLIPDEEESRLIDEMLGSTVQNSDGLITKVTGKVKLSDGFGQHYIYLRSDPPRRT